MANPPTPKPILQQVLQGLNLTEIFKEKGQGDIRRWSAKRTVGGAIVATACTAIAAEGLSWMAVALCAVGVLPLCLSVWEK